MSASLLSEPKTLAVVACEVWRLRKYYESNKDSLPIPVRHSIRKLSELLAGQGVAFIDRDGKEFDPGLNYEVLAVEEDDSLPEGNIIIKKTIKPIILFKEEMLAAGEVILARGIKNEQRKERKENDLRD
ncbi:MAG: hypothetical protein C4589_01035 [Peptococcaceae bacterium]|nr:MAG: hypothetical protein C4589_01035 [Peptococcaceae bacterium]